MATLAARTKRDWTEMPEEFFETKTLGELNVGDLFIFMPSPGDNDGHGGFNGPFYIFMKRNMRLERVGPGYGPDYAKTHCQTVRFCDKAVLDEPLHMAVLQIK